MNRPPQLELPLGKVKLRKRFVVTRSTAGLVPSRSAVAQGTGRSRSSTPDPARDRSLERAASIMARCFSGDVREYVDLVKSTRRADSRLDSVCEKRVLAITGRGFAIKPPPGYENDARANDNVDFIVRHFHETKGFRSKVAHLATAVIEGHGGLQHDFYRNARGETATRPRLVHARNFGWNVSTGEAGVYLADANGSPSNTLTPFSTVTPTGTLADEFVFHNPVGGGADDPWLRGAARSRLLQSVTKRAGASWWLKTLERHGQPQLVATGGENSDDDLSELAIEALRKLGSDWRAWLPAGIEIKEIPISVKTDLHERWVKRCDADDAVRILGQNLSTEVAGGSFAATRAHMWVLAAILEGDLAELEETICDQWIEPLIRFNRPGTPVPWIYFNPSPIAELTPADMTLVDENGRRIFGGEEYRAAKGYDKRATKKLPSGGKPAEPKKLPASTKPTDAPEAIASDATKVADTALNGAQIQALQGLLAAVAGGTLPKDSAIAVITASFPTIDLAKAQAMVSPIVVAPATPAPGGPA